MNMLGWCVSDVVVTSGGSMDGDTARLLELLDLQRSSLQG